jgi:hypothetical protein
MFSNLSILQRILLIPWSRLIGPARKLNTKLHTLENVRKVCERGTHFKSCKLYRSTLRLDQETQHCLQTTSIRIPIRKYKGPRQRTLSPGRMASKNLTQAFGLCDDEILRHVRIVTAKFRSILAQRIHLRPKKDRSLALSASVTRSRRSHTGTHSCRASVHSKQLVCSKSYWQEKRALGLEAN